MRLRIVALALCVLSSSVHAQSLEHVGLKRSYKLYQPERQDKRPLVLLLHGGTMNAARVWRTSQFPEIAKREGLVLIAPDAVDGHWNDGRHAAFWNEKPIDLHDDVGFLSALIDKAIAEYNVDPARVYITGGSNGGNMAFRMACEKGIKLAGIAPAIASLQEKVAKSCKIDRPLPVILIAGTQDPLMPYEGGTSSQWSRENSKPDFEPRLSVRGTITFWAKHNGCTLEPDGEKRPDINTDDGSHVVAYRFENCAKGGPTAYYEVVGGGHHVPSLKGYRFLNNFLEKKLGNHNHDIDSEEVMWRFFENAYQ